MTGISTLQLPPNYSRAFEPGQPLLADILQNNPEQAQGILARLQQVTGPMALGGPASGANRLRHEHNQGGANLQRQLLGQLQGGDLTQIFQKALTQLGELNKTYGEGSQHQSKSVSAGIKGLEEKLKSGQKLSAQDVAKYIKENCDGGTLKPEELKPLQELMRSNPDAFDDGAKALVGKVSQAADGKELKPEDVEGISKEMDEIIGGTSSERAESGQQSFTNQPPGSDHGALRRERPRATAPGPDGAWRRGSRA